MIQVRRNIFETNSSSVHSLTLVDECDYEKWKRGELVYSRWNDEFITSEEAENEIRRGCNHYYEYEHCQDCMKEHGICYDYQCEGYYTYEGFFDDYDSYLESYCGKFTTKSGDKVVAFGRYGYDG